MLLYADCTRMSVATVQQARAAPQPQPGHDPAPSRSRSRRSPWPSTSAMFRVMIECTLSV